MNYICKWQYPDSFQKGEKANLHRRCRNNFKFEDGILYYRKDSKKSEVNESNDVWRICVGSDEEKNRIMESCHAKVEGTMID